jgi:hypothetical protein
VRKRVLDMLRGLGWVIVEVEGLRAAAAIVRNVGIILVREGATSDDLDGLADQAVMGQVPAPRRSTR